MNKIPLLLPLTFIIILGITLGFTGLNDNPKKKKNLSPGRNIERKTTDAKNSALFQNDNSGGGYQTFGTPYYTDNFDGANDTSSLKSRGYLVYYRGTGAQGISATWFQGSTLLFNSYNGPSTGYVAANFQVVNGINNIDNWLVLPKKSVSANDSIVFYSRSPDGDTYADSVRVMYSAAGDSLPESSWTELGRFKVSISGWQRKSFGAPSAGANARFAIRYNIVNGGPSGTNSDYIGIDALTLEKTPFTYDISVVSIDSVKNYGLPFVSTLAPKATFKNQGTANQTNIPVTYKVTGPVNYTKSKTIESLNSGAMAQVTFDSTFLPNITGTYNITVYTGLASDGYRANDTLKTSFLVMQPNYGGGGSGTGGYYFANSTPQASPAPSKPGYCRVDTSGSTSLVVNNTALTALTSGDLDDGYWTLTGITGVKRIKFMGVLYSSLYVGTNGIISFAPFNAEEYDPPSSGLPGGTVRPAVYPAWNDLDSRDTDQTTNRLTNNAEISNNRLIITYDKAPLYDGSSSEWETFQVCLELVPDNAGSANSNIIISHSNNTTLLNAPFLTGIQDATGSNFIQYTFINGSGNVITPGPISDTTAGSGVTVVFGPNQNILVSPCDKILSLTTNFESCPSPSQISVLIRNTVSPFTVIDSVTATGGAQTQYPAVFKNAANGVPYYIVVKSVNCLETWSASGVTFSGGAASYNFTTALSQAYNSNQKLSGGIPSIYQGDANQDGFVNTADVLLTYNNSSAFITSPSTDFNCDGLTDLTDVILAFNNNTNFVQKQRP